MVTRGLPLQQAKFQCVLKHDWIKMDYSIPTEVKGEEVYVRKNLLYPEPDIKLSK